MGEKDEAVAAREMIYPSLSLAQGSIHPAEYGRSIGLTLEQPAGRFTEAPNTVSERWEVVLGGGLG